MSRKNISILCIICLLIGGCLGRYFSSNEKVVTIDRIVEVEKIVENQLDKTVSHGTKTKTIKKTSPDGTITETKIEVGPKTSTESNTTKIVETSITKEKTTEHTNPKPNWALGVQSHWTFSELVHQEFYKFKPLVSGGYRLIGDVWLESSVMIDVSRMSNSTAGLGLRVEF